MEESPSSPLTSMTDPGDPDQGDIVSPKQPVDDAGPSKPSPKTKRMPSRPNTKTNRKPLVIRKQAKRSKWDAETILTDPKSPLATCDLRNIFSSSMAWDVLDAQEKAEILALFPGTQHILAAGTPEACPDFMSLRNDDGFRNDCAAYTDNIAQGRHEREWLESAWAAHERRKAGDYDEYLVQKLEEDWDVKLPPELATTRRQRDGGDGDAGEGQDKEESTAEEAATAAAAAAAASATAIATTTTVATADAAAVNEGDKHRHGTVDELQAENEDETEGKPQAAATPSSVTPRRMKKKNDSADMDIDSQDELA